MSPMVSRLLGLAAVMPILSVMGPLSWNFAFGAGAVSPLVYAGVGLVVLCGAAGNAAMARRLPDTTPYYGYIAYGLGRTTAAAVALIAVLTYVALVAGVAGLVGYYLAQIPVSAGWVSHAGAGVVVALAGVLGALRQGVRVVLALVAVCLQLAVLVALAVAVVVSHGPDAFPGAAVFGNSSVTSLGVGLVLGFLAFAGVESAAMHAGRVRCGPARAVTVAVIALMVLLAGTSWLVIGAVGADQVGELASLRPYLLMPVQVLSHLGKAGLFVTVAALCAGLLAGVGVLQRAAIQWLRLFAHGQLLSLTGDGERRFRATDWHASLCLALGAAALVALGTVCGLEWCGLMWSLSGLGALGVVVVQASNTVTGLAIVSRSQRRVWPTVPVLLVGLACLVAVGILLCGLIPMLAGFTPAAR
ncbi:hypothetical protein [Amycolatopsis sp. cmx-11-12]|uniref:hypothetical protein n=1 Tax=Amycolatopsis sp. cmx-11-12 TaxID=2785795 RepID=UPI003917ECF5